MKINILSRAKKKKFIEGLSNLGIKKIPQMLVRSGKERIRAFSGSLDREQIMDIWRLLPIEGVGLYVGKNMMNRNGVREVRMSLDGMHVWKEQLTKRVLCLTEKQEVDWFLGKNIDLNEKQKMEKGFVSVKSETDFVGTGKIGADGDKLFSFLPKERRRKEKMS
jgi:NOL1/NOP2/fmu family ribosome biogenesis protein